MQQKYKLSPSPAEKYGEYGEVLDTPLTGKKGTFGSLGQRISWKTPSGAAYSAQTSKSTLFDEPSTPAQIPQMGGNN